MFLKSTMVEHKHSTAREKATVPGSIKAIIETTYDALVTLFNDTFVNKDNFKRIVSGDNEPVEYSLNMICNVVNKNSKSFSEDFARAVHEYVFSNENVVFCDENVMVSSGLGNVDENDFAIMDEKTLNEILLINEYARRSRKENENALNMIALRIAHVLPASLATIENNPIDPKNFLLAFNKSCEKFHFEYDEKKYLFHAFDEGVLNALGNTYDKVNEVFVNHGVLPNMTRSEIVKKTSDANKGKQAGENCHNAFHHVGPVAPAPENGLDEKLVGWMSKTEAVNATNGTAYDDIQQLVRRDAGYHLPINGNESRPDGTLTALLNQYHAETSMPLKKSKKAMRIPLDYLIEEELPKIDRHFNADCLTKRDKSVIFLMNTLFKKMLDDKDASEKTKRQIARLQVPLLNVGLNDYRFFEDKEHPGRQLLNKIANADTGQDGHEFSGQERIKTSAAEIQARVENAIDEVVEKFKGSCVDSTAIAESVKKLDAIIADADKKCMLICTRLRQVEKAHQAVSQATKKINAAIKQAYGKQHVPQLIDDMARDVWRKNLMLASFKHGIDGHLWENLVKSLQFLVRSVQPKQTTNRKVLKKRQERAKKDLSSLCNNIHLPREKKDHYLKQLESLFNDFSTLQEDNQALDFLARHEAKIFDHESEDIKSNDKIGEKSEEKGAKAVKLSPEAQRFIEQLKYDTWVEYQDSEPIKKRCKYVCYAGERKAFIFVNRYGLKVLSLTRNELGEWVDSGAIKILQNSDIFDRALETTIEHMRQMARKKQLSS